MRKKFFLQVILISGFFICLTLISIFLKPDRPLNPQQWICPFCSGQSLFESNHPLAKELYQEIVEQIEAGVDTEEVFKTVYLDTLGTSTERYTMNKYFFIGMLVCYILKSRIWK